MHAKASFLLHQQTADMPGIAADCCGKAKTCAAQNVLIMSQKAQTPQLILQYHQYSLVCVSCRNTTKCIPRCLAPVEIQTVQKNTAFAYQGIGIVADQLVSWTNRGKHVPTGSWTFPEVLLQKNSLWRAASPSFYFFRPQRGWSPHQPPGEWGFNASAPVHPLWSQQHLGPQDRASLRGCCKRPREHYQWAFGVKGGTPLNAPPAAWGGAAWSAAGVYAYIELPF